MAPRRSELCVKFGRRLRQLRRERGLSQATLAERTDVTPEYVSRIERGAVGPSMDTIEKLCAALGVEAKSLFEFGTGPKAADQPALRLLDIMRHGSADERQLILRLAETVVGHKRYEGRTK